MNTFNLKQHLEKTANLSYDGPRGYFLSHQRAWMNCSKCKRVEGKSAQEAWQECFDEFQIGDHKASWLEAYAADEVAKLSKVSDVDYHDEIVKLSSEGMAIGAAVVTTLQKHAAWPTWLGGKGKPQEQNAPQTTNPQTSDPHAEAIQQQHMEQVKQQIGDKRVNLEQQNQKRMQAVQMRQQNTKTYNALHQITQLIQQDAYDSDVIRKIISGIPDPNVQQQLSQYSTYLGRVEKAFHNKITKMVDAAQKMMQYYMSNGRKSFIESTPAAPSKPSKSKAAFDDQAVKTAQLTSIPRTKDGWLSFINFNKPETVRYVVTTSHKMSQEFADDPDIQKAYKHRTGYDIDSKGQVPGLVGRTAQVSNGDDGGDMGSVKHFVLRTHKTDSVRGQWAYYGENAIGTTVDANLAEAKRFSWREAEAKVRELAAQRQFYIITQDTECDWSEG